MHHTTRRLKRFKRSVSSSRGLLQKSDSTLSQLHLLNASGDTNSPSGSRHRRVARSQLDPLRGAILIAIIVVTILLYLALWELERSSFTLVPKGNFGSKSSNPKSTATSQPLVTSKRVVEKYLVVTSQDESIPRSQDQPNLIPTNDRPTVSSFATEHSPPQTKAAKWPPPITRVPDEHPQDVQMANFPTDENASGKPRSTLSDSIDVAYCNGTCRFLLPVRVGEQESKARLHFTQLLKLAERLNRTLVLPNVGKSRMSVCSKWAFEAYYDTNAFASGSQSLPAITNLVDFTKWVDGRPEVPSNFLVSMDSPPKDHWRTLGYPETDADLPFVVEELGFDSKVMSCLESKLSRLRSSMPAGGLSILFNSGSRKTHPNASNHLIQLLSGRVEMHANSDFDLMTGPSYGYPHPYDDSLNTRPTSLHDINVLIVDYDLRYPLFAHSDSSNFNLHYAPALYDLADRITDNVGPFVGVHWRMESVPVENLAWCAASLVSTLYRFLQDENMGKNIRHVWLATDYLLPQALLSNTKDAPLASAKSRSGPPRKSSTFKTLSPEHEDAIEMLTEAFQQDGDLDSWKLTDLAEQLRLYPYVEGRFDIDEALLDDSGVFGILDKLVVVQASVFVSGSPECSKVSSFSKQVVEARQESLEARRGRDLVRNIVDYFGK